MDVSTRVFETYGISHSGSLHHMLHKTIAHRGGSVVQHLVYISKDPGFDPMFGRYLSDPASCRKVVSYLLRMAKYWFGSRLSDRSFVTCI